MKAISAPATPVYIVSDISAGGVEGVEQGIPIRVVDIGHTVSSVNSTTDLLLADEGFTGEGEDVTKYTVIVVTLNSDVASADKGLSLQFSNDGIDWEETDAYTYASVGNTKTYTVQRIDSYFRIVYTNGSTGQTHFHITTIFNAFAGVHSSHRIGDTITNEDDAQLVKAVLSGEEAGGRQVNITSTPAGELKTSVITATGTLPVSQLATSRDGKILNRPFPENDEITGTGTATYQDGNKYQLAVGPGEWLVYQSRRFYPYFSGKPQKVELTVDDFHPEADLVKYKGYFSSSATTPHNTVYDGFYLESGNGTITFNVLRAGTVVHTADITEWTSYEDLNGFTDPAHWENFTVVEFNFLWLGGAYIEMKVMTDTGFHVVHHYSHAGAGRDVFMRSPNQPVRYEIRSTTGTGSMRYICNQVASAGSISESGFSKSVNTGSSVINLATAGVKYPVLALRKGTSYRENPIKIASLAGLVTTNDTLLWTLEINPTLSSPLSYSAVPNSAAEYATGDGSITVSGDGIVVVSEHLTQGGKIDPSLLKNNFLSWLSGSIDGTQDQYVLCATPVTTNLNVLASMVYMEA